MVNSLYFHYGIPFFNYIKETSKNLISYTYYFYNSIVNSFHSDIVYFFDKNPNAYIGSYIDIHNSNNGVVVWKYSRSMKKFFQYSCEYKDIKYYPIITAYITLDGKTVYDLTEFFNELRIERTNADYPNLQQLLEVWTYTERIVLDRRKEYTILYMDNHLNEFTKNLFHGTFEFTS